MSKRRKTRQEKIILQLRRELTQKKVQVQIKAPPEEPRQEAISEARIKLPIKIKAEEKQDKPIFFYPPSLVKKDLLKTLGLTIGVISLEIVLYLKLR